ncbi:MAG: 4Fe-4S dicluster domain-containing protein [Candidatus Nanopelagicales bacterium]
MESSANQNIVGPAGLDELISLLRDDGFEVLGPMVRNGAIVIEPIVRADDLPRGWGDTQDGGLYRIAERSDDAFFGFAAPAGTWKRYLFPPRSVLWRSRRDGSSVTVEDAVEEVPRRALFGIRGCDLAAVAVQDRVFLNGGAPDPVYAARREGLFFVGVNCSDPATTCFCPSMGTGPDVKGGADLVLTELDPGDPDRHRFLIDVGTERGRQVAAQLTQVGAADSDRSQALKVTQTAIDRMTRSMNTVGLQKLLMESAEHPQWQEVADRCLSCGNCTMACPTCFCSDVADEPNAATGDDERVRQWGSCFERSHSYIHGGPVRVSTKSRYRQWMTHKLSTWWDQFDMSGCVGCGRCIAWCPVGIDITEEVRAIQLGDDDRSKQEKP